MERVYYLLDGKYDGFCLFLDLSRGINQFVLNGRMLPNIHLDDRKHIAKSLRLRVCMCGWCCVLLIRAGEQ